MGSLTVKLGETLDHDRRIRQHFYTDSALCKNFGLRTGPVKKVVELYLELDTFTRLNVTFSHSDIFPSTISALKRWARVCTGSFNGLISCSTNSVAC